MVKSVAENKPDLNKEESVCNLNYLSELMGGNRESIREIMDVFLKQIPEEMQSINIAIAKSDYPTIKKFAHTMKSTVSVMGITSLASVLSEMEDLAAKATGPESYQDEKLKTLNQKLNLLCNQAIKEIERLKLKY